MNPVPPSVLRVGLLLCALVATVPGQGFVDVATSSGLELPNSWQASLGRGPCFGDFDGDGDQDVIFPGVPGQPLRHYRNDGGLTFTNLTGTTGLESSTTETHAVVAADIDNDGDLDAFIANAWTSNKLYINDGTGNFVDEAVTRGVEAPLAGCYTASFGDYDRDGLLDLYVGNWQAPTGGGEANILFRNTGNGFFTDVTAAAGVGNTGLTFTGVWHDYDEDGWPDLFVGNDKGFYAGNEPDTTYRNNGNGTFTDVGATINTRFAIGAMGSDFTDAFNDGGWDIFVSNTSAGHLFHVWNPTTQIYDEQATLYGVVANAEGWATNFFDYDNDGWQDLYIVHAGARNHLYRNPGAAGGPWTEVAGALGCDVWGNQYTSAVGDLDDDGRLDLLLPNPFAPGLVLRNTVPAGNYVRFRTIGTRSNRDGIGSVVEVTIGGVTQRQTVRTGHGYLGGHDLRAHFGVGPATTVDQVKITWPSGQTQILTNVAANQTHEVTEPDLGLTLPPVVGTTTSLTFASPRDANGAYFMALTLGTAPGVTLPDGRTIPANPDALFLITQTTGNPVLPANAGLLSATGTAASPLVIPNLPALIGQSVYAFGLTGDASAPSSIAAIAGPLQITIQ